MRFARSLCAAAFIGLCSPVALAQTSANGSIRGYIRDPQEAVLPGTTITATSPTVPTIFTAVSDKEGYYRLLELPPGEYIMTAELQGFATFTRPGIVVRAGLNLGVDIEMKVGNVTETVEVKADTPMLESKTAVQAVNISGQFQRSVPLASRRNWSDFFELTPGVTTYRSSAEFYYVHGANLDAMVTQVDGADMNGGQQGGNVYLKFSPELIEDVQVKVGAFDAASPLGTGAIVNLATPTGTNQLQGSAGVTHQGRNWHGNNAQGGTPSAQGAVLADASAGGPLTRDRAWFFGAYRYNDRRIGIDRTTQQIDTLRAIVPGFQPFDTINRAHFSFVKGTVQLSPRHQAYGFYQYDRNPSSSGGPTSAARLSTSSSGGPGAAARLSSIWGPSLTTRVTASYTNKVLNIQTAFKDRPGRVVHRNTFLSGGQVIGTGSIAFLDTSSFSGQDLTYPKTTISGDVTYYRPGWLGSHEFQSGVYLQQIHQRADVFYYNGGFVLEELVLRNPADPSAGMVPFHRRVFDTERARVVSIDVRDVAAYVQDAWKLAPRLTVNAGVRIDAVHKEDTLFTAQVQNSIDVGPRLGVNYLLTADGRNAVRASWVRVHDVATQISATAGSAVVGFRDLFDPDLDGTFKTVFVTPPSSALNPNSLLDPKLHQPYINEFVGGYRRQLPGLVSVDVSVDRRTFLDRSARIEVNGLYEGGQFRGYRNEALNDIFLNTNNTFNWPVYTDIELQVTKQTRRLQLLSSYTRQWHHLAGTWQPNDPAAFIQPDTFPNDKGIGSTKYSETNSLSGSAYTRAPQWKDHAARIGGSVHAPWGLTVAANYIYQSGVWSGPIVMRLAASDPRFGPPTVRLSNGRLVSNPLATPLRFAFRTVGEGQFRLDGVHVWNLRVARNLPLGTRRLELAADLYNLTNGGNFEDQDFGSNQTYSPVFRQGAGRQLPRSAQLSLRWAF